MEYRETISNLKFISLIKPEEKINVEGMYVQPNNLYTRIARTFSTEDKSKTLKFIQNTIDNSITIMKKIVKNEDPDSKRIFKNIYDDLKNSKIGIKNLKETYKTDRKFGTDLDTICLDIDYILSSNAEHLE